uniref:Putative group v salivary lipocalin n=1 Tax=Hyalomma excavatum TaxID=257692 RepID=A0A131XJV7_9ACAR
MKYGFVKEHLIKVIIITGTTALCLNVNAEQPHDNTKETDATKVLRIVDVFNTSEVLWQYWKNYTDDSDATSEDIGVDVSGLDLTTECAFISIYNITSTDVNFYYNTMMMNQLVRSHYLGHFFAEDNDELGSMNVTDISAGDKDPFEVMKLGYYDGSCSVFFLTSYTENSDAGCDMYLRNSHISTGPSKECEDFYETYCMQKTKVYESTCPDKVREGEEELQIIMTKNNKCMGNTGAAYNRGGLRDAHAVYFRNLS